VIIRRKEKNSLLKGIPKNLSSLSYAYLLAQKASQLGFDWPDLSGVLKKMDEELGEFREALAQPPHHLGGVARGRSLRVATPPLRNRRRIAEEMGDLLFVLVNVGRFLGIDPEEALKRTLEKFCARFQYIETSLRRAGKTVQESNLKEMDRLWNEAKKSKKNLKRG
jgi:tetrapyrrole methylase family protein / MazG family protein